MSTLKTKAAGFERVDWYDEPLYYDILLAEDTPIEADFLEAVLARHGPPRAERLLEPACGGGRLMVELARRGYALSGFDLSRSMLRFAEDRLREAGLGAELVRTTLQGFRMRRKVDMAYCLLSSFRYLLDEESARSHLERIAASLRKGGIYVLGLHLSQYEWEGVQRERWVAQRGDLRVVCNLQSWPVSRKRRRESLRSRVTVTRSGEAAPIHRMETSWDFRTYDAQQLQSLLRSVPELEHVATYDFTYDLSESRELDDDLLDRVLILRRV